MSFHISEKDLSMITSIEQFRETFEKIDNYIYEKEKLLQDLDLKILSEQKNYQKIYSEFMENENILNKLDEDEKKLLKELSDQEEKETKINEIYTKMSENLFDNKIRIIPNEQPYPEDKYFTIEWILPRNNENYTFYIMFEIDTRKIVKMNDQKGKILDKENIDWSIFPLNDKRNRNFLLMEIYKEYGVY